MNKLVSIKANILFLIIIQFVNFLTPLIAYPYISNKMGAQKFGEVMYVYSIVGIIGIIVEFGFSLGGVKDISARRWNKLKISNYILAGWSIHIGFTVLSYIICLVIVVLNKSNEYDIWMYSIGFLMIVGQILFSNWLLQGLEMLKEAATMQVISKIVTLPILFILVRGPEDGIGALLYLVSPTFVSGILGVLWIFNNKLISLKYPPIKYVSKVVERNFALFVSKSTIALYTNLIPVVLGNISGPAELAKYIMADKVRMSIQAILSTVSQAIFPRMSFLMKKNVSMAKDLILKTSLIVGGLSIIVALVVSLYSERIMLILGGADFKGAGLILLWLSFVPCLTVVSNILGIQIMLPLNLNKQFNLIITIGAVVSLIGLWPSVVNNGALGAARVVFISELLISISMIIYFVCVRKNTLR